MMSWRKIAVSKTKELNLRFTLMGGQSFRWKEVDKESEEVFMGVFSNILWKLKQNDDFLFYKVEGEVDCDPIYLKLKLNIKEPPSKSKRDDKYYEQLLRTYFRLNVNLSKLCQQWENAHVHFKEITNQKYIGVRVLDQAVTENIISFICSQNNNIKRISSMVSKICEMYGRKIKNVAGVDWYSFPNIEELSDPQIEEKLRTAGFGYRAKYIAKCSDEIREKGELLWYSKIQSLSYKEAHTELISLTGIGPKVADCICLMSLGHLDAIPVDTHVFQIAKSHYLPALKSSKTITKSVYDQVKVTFKDIYGPYAGWAQTVMFIADLKQFQLSSKKNINLGEGTKTSKKLKTK